MNAPLALGGPFVAAAAASVARRRVGAWASWVLLLALWVLLALFGIRDAEVWWNEPGFLSDLSEMVGALYAAMTMALLLQSFGRVRPSLVTQVALAGLAGVGVQWAYARLGRFPSLYEIEERGWGVLLLGMWLVGLLIRDFKHRERARRAGLRAEREA